MHHPTDRISHTTAFVTPVVEHWLEREIAQWVHPMNEMLDASTYVLEAKCPKHPSNTDPEHTCEISDFLHVRVLPEGQLVFRVTVSGDQFLVLLRPEDGAHLK